MKKLYAALLSGCALCALGSVPSVARTAFEAPPFHVPAMHGGRIVNKTKMPNRGATHVTYTFDVYSYVPGSSADKQRLPGYRSCETSIKAKVAPKKTAYAKIGVYVETYTDGCEKVGATYKVSDPPQTGVDNFVLSVSGKFENGGTKYKGTLNLDYTVFLQ